MSSLTNAENIIAANHEGFYHGLERAASWHDEKAKEARADADNPSRVGTAVCELRAQWHEAAATTFRSMKI